MTEAISASYSARNSMLTAGQTEGDAEQDLRQRKRLYRAIDHLNKTQEAVRLTPFFSCPYSKSMPIPDKLICCPSLPGPKQPFVPELSRQYGMAITRIRPIDRTGQEQTQGLIP